MKTLLIYEVVTEEIRIFLLPETYYGMFDSINNTIVNFDELTDDQYKIHDQLGFMIQKGRYKGDEQNMKEAGVNPEVVSTLIPYEISGDTMLLNNIGNDLAIIRTGFAC